MTESKNDKPPSNVIKLHDGRQLTIDIYAVPIAESIKLPRAALDGDWDEYFRILGLFVGLSAEEVGELPIPDYRALDQGVAALARMTKEGNPT